MSDTKPRCDAAIWRHFRNVRCDHPAKFTVDAKEYDPWRAKDKEVLTKRVHLCGVHRNMLIKRGRTTSIVVSDGGGNLINDVKTIMVYSGKDVEPSEPVKHISHRGLKMEGDDGE